MNLKKTIAGLLALIMLLSMAGCGGAGVEAAEVSPQFDAAPAAEAEETPAVEETPAPTPEPEEDKRSQEEAAAAALAAQEEAAAAALAAEKEAWAAEVEGLDRIGQQTEDGYQVKLLNLSGTDVTVISVKVSGTGDFSANMLAEGDVYTQEETALLCYDPGDDGADVTYDFQITFDDWTVGELHNVTLSDIREAELYRRWNGLPYLVYTSVSTGEEINTSDFEQAYAENAIAAGTWDYGNGAPAVSDNNSGNSGNGYSYSAGVNSGGGGNDDSCLDDALFW